MVNIGDSVLTLKGGVYFNPEKNYPQISDIKIIDCNYHHLLNMIQLKGNTLI